MPLGASHHWIKVTLNVTPSSSWEQAFSACVTPNATLFISPVEFPLNHFQKPHKRKQSDHISCRGSPGIPLVLFLLSRPHVTHCFDWQDFEGRAPGLLEPCLRFSRLLSATASLSLSSHLINALHTGRHRKHHYIPLVLICLPFLKSTFLLRKYLPRIRNFCILLRPS